jgi:hypothetical protein
MLAKLKIFSLLGIDALPVEVEVSPAGLPKTVLVGLPEAAVKESTHRVERAIVNSGFQRPQNRVVINLAPACSRLSQSTFGGGHTDGKGGFCYINGIVNSACFLSLPVRCRVSDSAPLSHCVLTKHTQLRWSEK